MTAIADMLNSVGFKLSRLLILVFSILSLAFWVYLRFNVWQEVGYVIFAVPFGMLICSCLGLRIINFNYPIWRRMFGSFVVPILSGLIFSLSNLLPDFLPV